MGSTVAAGMAEAVGEGLVSLRGAVSYHLTCNHYPPHPDFMVDVAMDAIDAACDEEWDRLIDLPEGAEHRRYGKRVPAAEIIRSLHLDAFVQYEEE